MTLSDRQRNAARRLGEDVCVIAGPGSGKTRVLIERFAWLVKENSVEPNRILTITFTEKAATEIKQRLVTRFLDDASVRERIERAWVSTIHGFCMRLLRENAIAAALDPQFEIIDESDGYKLLRSAMDQALEELYALDPGQLRVFLRSLAVSTYADGEVPDLAASLIEIYQAMRTAGARIGPEILNQTPLPDVYTELRLLAEQMSDDPVRPHTNLQIEGYERRDEWLRRFLASSSEPSEATLALLLQPELTNMVRNSVSATEKKRLKDLSKELHAQLLLQHYAPQRELIVHTLQRAHQLYTARKRAISRLDFSDLEEQAIALLESNAAVRASVQQSFDYILMDELQDTNLLQWKLLDLVRKPKCFFAVGDVNQSIFSFRYAEPQLFQKYRDEVRARGEAVDELHENYRSRAGVLDAVNAVFAGPEQGIESHTLIEKRPFGEKLKASVETLHMTVDGDSEAAERLEALSIARRMADLAGNLQVGEAGQERPCTFGDMAVLVRAKRVMGPIQDALDRFGIPFVVNGGRTFFDTREVRDCLLWLRALAMPMDEISLAGVLRSPLVGISDESLMRLCQGDNGKYLFEVLEAGIPEGIEAGDAVRLSRFVKNFRESRAVRNSVSVERVLRRAIDESGYEAGLNERARANVEKLLAMVRDRGAASHAGISQMLDDLEASDMEAEAPPSDAGNAVRLLTMHTSKGLEFPIVFLPGLHRPPNNSEDLIVYDSKLGLGVKWRESSSQKGCGDAVHNAITYARKQTRDEEENRLLYVAMTRAEEHLVLSFSASKSKGPWSNLLKRKLLVGADTERNERGVRVANINLEPAIERVKLRDGSPEIAEPAILAVNSAAEQFDATGSVSSVSLYAACPRKYYLARYLRWTAQSQMKVFDPEDEPRADLGELDASEFGTQVHQLLAGTIDASNADPEALKLRDRFEKSELHALAMKASRMEREFDFIMEDHGIVLRGQIDLWFEHKGKLYIVDYKTDQVRAPIDPERVADYALQLQYYAMALEKLTGKPVYRACLHFLRPDVLVDADLSPLAVGAARDMLLRFRNAHEALDFPLQEGTQCVRCEFYRGICPAGKKKSGEGSTSLRLLSSSAARASAGL
jgi:ATP-dependent helicase/nuclease subunit A